MTTKRRRRRPTLGILGLWLYLVAWKWQCWIGYGCDDDQSGLAMTDLLERAIARLQTLSEREQDAIASIILEEIEDEQRWDKAFSRSPDTLAKLAASAIAEYHAGETQELDPDSL